VYTGSTSPAYYRHSDHLGSSRFASTPTQTLYSDTAYSPFGEPYASSGSIDNSFTGQNQDTTAGLYDFLFREYDPNQARWTQPDPAGLASVDQTSPQSWNRYAYVLNRPTVLIDQSGLYTVCIGGFTYDEADFYVDDIYQSSDYTFIGDTCGGPAPLLAGGGGDVGRGGGGGGSDLSNRLPFLPSLTPSQAKNCAAAQAKAANLKQQLHTLNPNKLLRTNIKEVVATAFVGCATEAFMTTYGTDGLGAPFAAGACVHGGIAGGMMGEAIFLITNAGELWDVESTGVQGMIADAEAQQACHP
jgi:RHS repeat-associated protein